MKTNVLSKREREVLKLIGDGKMVSEIARELTLSVKTVSTYRARLCQKLALPTTNALMRHAIVTGLSPIVPVEGSAECLP